MCTTDKFCSGDSYTTTGFNIDGVLPVEEGIHKERNLGIPVLIHGSDPLSPGPAVLRDPNTGAVI